MPKQPRRFSFQGKKYTYKQFERLMGGSKKKPDALKDAVEVMKKKLETR